MMDAVKITVLNDNTAGRNCLAEHGLSFYIETPAPYLFDTGFSEIFLENARRLKVDIKKVENVVLSHGHDDHSGGLRYLKSKTLVGHPDLFMKRYRKSNHTPLGILFDAEEAVVNYQYKLKLSKIAVQLDQRSWFLGEIPRVTPFESKTTAFVDQEGKDDFVNDDSGMAILTSKGLVVISGCAHAGIGNMILHARNITGVDKIYAIIGGFHLVADDELTRQTIQFLKNMKVEKVMPSHCTQFPALVSLYKEFGFIQVKSGNVIVF
jgi:7,8-dihydropterin-6-yl-methyl-4-(beta-D-ribofuranosyl)aminobenzene 5'-phosphate synthase